ncbi:MAG: sigma-54 dependent transcriptional regulator [Candidatus Marinimicrobia bacterium]|nr:sigma-54 dependent transcriptional regulator [Candidatus Neomarinimicrobiota bacterium]
MAAFSVLIVDDEKVIRSGLKALLGSVGYQVDTAQDGLEALMLYKDNHYTLVLSDINMPNLTGIEMTKQLKLMDPDATVVLFTGYSSIESALEAMKSGAEEYLLKPINNDEVLNMVSRVYERWDLRRKNDMLRQEILRAESLEIIGSSAPINKVKSGITQAADSMHPILISGAAGTGKRIIARAIHNQGPRKDEAFVVLDCASTAVDQLEAALFGYEAETFPETPGRKYGLLEVAHGGTLYIDEISMMTMDLQSKLLIAIETSQLFRLGSKQAVNFNSRIIASTKLNLLRLVEEGNFREDLYYKLNSIPIDLPALKDRKDDIPLLVDYFSKKNGRKESVGDLEADFMEALQRYDWPGNQRELQHVLERVFMLVGNEPPSLEFLPPEISDVDHQFSGGYRGDIKRATLAENEREYMLKTFRELGGNMTHVAKALGLNLKSLYDHFEKAGLGYLYQRGDK